MREKGDATAGVYKLQDEDCLQHSISRGPKATISMYKLVSTVSLGTGSNVLQRDLEIVRWVFGVVNLWV
jgi:hypothetical protein